jgi:hypothetical protein
LRFPSEYTISATGGASISSQGLSSGKTYAIISGSGSVSWT